MKTPQPPKKPAVNVTGRAKRPKRFPPTRPSKKLKTLAKAFLALSVALLLVVGMSAAGTGDYMLVMDEGGQRGVGSKSKSLADCREAQWAAWNGWLVGVPERTPTRCDPRPDVFESRSNCIQGFNCK